MQLRGLIKVTKNINKCKNLRVSNSCSEGGHVRRERTGLYLVGRPDMIPM